MFMIDLSGYETLDYEDLLYMVEIIEGTEGVAMVEANDSNALLVLTVEPQNIALVDQVQAAVEFNVAQIIKEISDDLENAPDTKEDNNDDSDSDKEDSAEDNQEEDSEEPVPAEYPYYPPERQPEEPSDEGNA